MKKKLFIGAMIVSSIFAFAQQVDTGLSTDLNPVFWGSTTGCTESAGVKCCTTIHYIFWIKVSQESTCTNT